MRCSRQATRQEIREELRVWRDGFTVDMARRACAFRGPSYSFGGFCTGGCLDTLAAIRSGFIPLWGTEIDPQRAEMFCHLSSAPCLGDTFAVDFTRQSHVVLLWSGQPCPDYSTGKSGGPVGAEGDTGWQFARQYEKVLEVMPDCFVLEMVPNALYIDGGSAVKTVLGALTSSYRQFIEVVKVAEHGDASARERLLIVGFRRATVSGDAANLFAFPRPQYNAGHYHIAADIAVPDEEVEEQYWLHDSPPLLPPSLPQPLQMHQVARVAPGMGFSERPHAVQSWLGLVNTQTTHNGGGRRPPLQWRYGEPLVDTRLMVPVETCRAASLPCDYQAWCNSFNSGNEKHDDRHLRECVNMGVPVRTACAVNAVIHSVLVAAGIPFDVYPSTPSQAEAVFAMQEAAAMRIEAKDVGSSVKVESIKVDTGATTTFMGPGVEPYLRNPTPSSAVIRVASDKVVMKGRVKGTMKANVVNMASYDTIPKVTPGFDMHPTTVDGLTADLLSVDEYYRQGRFNVLLRQPDFEDGVSELYRAPRPGSPAVRIPLTYDWNGSGGWYMHYIPAEHVDTRDVMLCCNTIIDTMAHSNRETALLAQSSFMSDAECSVLHDTLAHHPCVDEVILSSVQEAFAGDGIATGPVTGVVTSEDQHRAATRDDPSPMLASEERTAEKLGMVWGHSEGEREILGVKAGMRQAFKRMSRKEFHERFSHCGTHKGCRTCQMAKGLMRRIFTKVDPYRENRVGHTWAMDGITFNTRSEQGCLYLVVLRDLASGAFHLIPLYRKSDIVPAFRDWVLQMRANPVYQHMPYPVVSKVRTDNEGTWNLKAGPWNEMLSQLSPLVEMEYVCPDAHAKENGFAEAAVKLVEHQIKCSLYAANLPKSYWQFCAADALFLLNRFPALSDDAVMPADGDRARPLEMLSRGYWSRRTLDRALNYFVPVGTPALVHVPSLGSSLDPKTRWGVCIGMYNEQPTWRCPYTKATFRSKSYSAYRLREGLNFAQFLNIPLAPSAQAQMQVDAEIYERPELIVQLRDPVPSQFSPVVIADETARVRAQHGASVPSDPSRMQMGEVGPKLSAEGRVLQTDPTTGRLFYAPEQQTEPTLPESTQPTSAVPAPFEAPDSDESDDPSPDSGPADPAMDLLLKDQSTAIKRSARKRQAEKDAPGQDVPLQTMIPAVPADVSQCAPPPVKKHKTSSGPKSCRVATPVAPPDMNSGGQVPVPSMQVMELPDDFDSILDLETVPGYADELQKEDWETSAIWERAVVAGSSCLLKNLLKRVPLVKVVPPQLHELYRDWLVTIRGYLPKDVPWKTSRGKPSAVDFVKIGIKLPEPYGKEWAHMLRIHHRQSKAGKREDEIERAYCAEESLVEVFMEQRVVLNAFKAELAGYSPSKFTAKKGVKAVAVGHKAPPKTLGHAFHGPDAAVWMKSATEEFDGLTEAGVLEHGLTLSQLAARGVPINPVTGRVKPMPLSIVLDHKYTDGVLTRYKTRMALAGHKGNMKKGEHYDKTFAASPNSNSSRLLQALMVTHKWKRLCFDIKQAYIHSDLPPGKLIAIRYPDGFKRNDPETGEELFCLLKKNLYGHPAASRAWSQTRDAFLLSHFNPPDGSWTCSRCVSDPCLFRLTQRRGDKVHQAIMLVYTDDCDVIGDDEDMMQSIYAAISSKWGAKIVPADFVLGVKRDLTVDAETGSMTVDLSMGAFIDGMVDAFAEHLSDEPADTPFPTDAAKISRYAFSQGRVGDDIIAKNLDRGYMRAVGMLLWAARNVYAECAVGVSILCRVMSCPDDNAWEAAMHMIRWLRGQRDRGIRFTTPPRPSGDAMCTKLNCSALNSARLN